MSQLETSLYADVINLNGFFAYRSPNDDVALGFMIRLPRQYPRPEPEARPSEYTRQAMVSAILELVDCYADKTMTNVDDIDWDLCKAADVELNYNENTFQRMGPDGRAYLMIRDSATLSDTIKQLIGCSKQEITPKLSIDVVPDRHNELQMISFFHEVVELAAAA